ncbi:hypothetical protein LH716_004271 [Vibrio vulnificus]|nr:hypothetical protein [Vibrio vulnificus]EJL6405502.1 hypothetical protein [Vibrio parahaemolyticus]EHK9068659.1 hypothetical protein [Vibrio vulnificus]EIJ0971178.1 hypothetical protein [Vibrio vulnificus]EIO4061428.1 hypothetical protein [Vibrio vulnificus]
MKKTAKLEKYTELFLRNLQKFLAPGVSIKTKIYPVEAQGAVFEFTFNRDDKDTIEFASVMPTVGHVLSVVPQRMIAGNIQGVTFGGTNIYMEGDRLLLIKGEDSKSSWDGNAANDDVRRVASTSQGGK